MDKEEVVYTHTHTHTHTHIYIYTYIHTHTHTHTHTMEYYLASKKGHLTIYNSMDEPGHHYVK